MQQVVQSGDVKLAVYCQGNRNGPAVVLVHGYPDDHSVWDGVVATLQQDFFVVTYDVRGAGQSTAPQRQQDYRLEQLSADLLAVLDAVCADRPVHLVAHDWGSIQTWESVTDPALRQRIASFTSISGPCLDHMGFWLRDKLRSPNLENLKALFGQYLRSWYVMLFHFPGTGLIWRAGLARLWPWLLRRVEKVPAESRVTQAKDGANGVRLYRANFLRRLFAPGQRKTDVPVQLIIPERDLYVSPHLFAGMQQWVSRLWLRRLPAGHWLPLQQPVALAGMLREFIEAIESDDDDPLPTWRILGKVQPESGKLVLVTGAGSGIGRATALEFAARGASVIVVDLNKAAAERTALLVRLLDSNAWVFNVDVGDRAAMAELVQQVCAQIGVPDVVINNAGIGMAGGMLQTSADDWERILHVNLWGVINGASLFGKAMTQANHKGHIVNVASAAAFSPSRTFPAYATSKAAVLMLSECLRAEFGRHGIGVNTICPGFVETGIALNTQYVGVTDSEQQRRRKKADQLYQRRGFTPEQVARAIVHAVQRNKALTLVGIEAVGAHWLQRLAPTLSRWFARFDLSPN